MAKIYKFCKRGRKLIWGAKISVITAIVLMIANQMIYVAAGALIKLLDFIFGEQKDDK